MPKFRIVMECEVDDESKAILSTNLDKMNVMFNPGSEEQKLMGLWIEMLPKSMLPDMVASLTLAHLMILAKGGTVSATIN